MLNYVNMDQSNFVFFKDGKLYFKTYSDCNEWAKRMNEKGGNYYLNLKNSAESGFFINLGAYTNITYSIVGKSLSDKEINEINAIDDHLSRMKTILDAGCKLQFCEIDNPTFNNNLLFLDSAMPLFLAECLKYANMPDNSLLISDVVHHIATCNPLNYPGQNVDSFYQHKMKVLLLDAALGMTPSKEWNGYYDANGGYLVVRQDGEIVCYHFYNRNQVEDYLFYNTRFDRPSRSRHNYGTIYKANDGTPQIKLNIQIRFTK